MIKKLYHQFLRLWNLNTRERYARAIGVQVGEGCRLYSANFGSEPYLVHIGDHVTVTQGVQFITHDGGLWVLREEIPGADYIRPIIVHRNSFIGINTIILPGITIGPNSVVGAGAIVTKDIPPNTVAAGIPARVINSLDQYRRRISDDLLIHGMSKTVKKQYLLGYFGTTVEEWTVKMKKLKM